MKQEVNQFNVASMLVLDVIAFKHQLVSMYNMFIISGMVWATRERDCWHVTFALIDACLRFASLFALIFFSTI